MMYRQRDGYGARILRWFKFIPFLWIQLRCLYTDYRQLGISGENGIKYGKNVTILGTPVLAVSNGAKIILGKNVMLDSFNRGYHANMFAPVKLVVSAPGAIIEIGDDSRIHGACIHARQSVRIGKRCLVAANCQIIDSNGHELAFDDVDNRLNTTGVSSSIEIEDSVWLGIGCIVMPGVKIGRGTVVGAGSVVTRSLPSMCFAAGVPAKVIRDYCKDNN